MTIDLATSAPDGRRVDEPGGAVGVLLVDDHAVFAEALAVALDAQPDLGPVTTAQTAAEALAALAVIDDVDPRRPLLVVVDVQLGTAGADADGVALLARVRAVRPTARALVLTAHPRPEVVRRALAAGAAGVVAKGARLPEVLAAVRAAAAGRAVPPGAPGAPDLWGGAVEAGAVGAGVGAGVGVGVGGGVGVGVGGATLSPREREVLQLVAGGADARGAAGTLGLSIHTVRDHLKSVRSKLGVHSQIDAVVAAYRLGLVELDQT